MKRFSARAHANVALVKYWGKRDSDLILPHNNSISVTLDALYTDTILSFEPEQPQDIFQLNGTTLSPESKEYTDYIGRFLKLVRKQSSDSSKVKIISENNFPTGAGLASSASGFAALAAVANSAFELGLDQKQLSTLARQGSGSASRSIHGGFVEWQKGEEQDGSDSYAEQLLSPDKWDEFSVIACITTQGEKKIKSRAGMAQTVSTSPDYKYWLETVEEDLEQVRKGIKVKNFTLVGETAERNALKMHFTMQTTKPPIFYWNGATLEIIHKVIELREEGIECYFTIDAGPQVKVLCLKQNQSTIQDQLQRLAGVQKTIPCGVGGATHEQG